MASTSKKHANFVSGPIRDKPVKDIPGIGTVLGDRLKRKGFDRAYKLQGKYLTMGKNDTEFENWLKEDIGANQKQATDCSKALRDWCNNYMD